MCAMEIEKQHTEQSKKYKITGHAGQQSNFKL
jgi:hypothetical protein